MHKEPLVVSVHKNDKHQFSKGGVDSITLLKGLGVEGDAHCGATIQHRFDRQKDPTKPNLRQVHLIHTELLDEVNAKGFRVLPGEMGENIATRGLDLLALPTGAQLHIGAVAIVEVTGLRNPCLHIERFQKGLLSEMRVRNSGDGGYSYKAGVMGIVVRGGIVLANDRVIVVRPAGEQSPLKPV